MPMHQAKVLDRSALLGDLDAALRQQARSERDRMERSESEIG